MSWGDGTEHLAHGSPAGSEREVPVLGQDGLCGLGMKHIPGDREGRTILCRQDSAKRSSWA